jgi:polysaccharide export outer membrane protein
MRRCSAAVVLAFLALVWVRSLAHAVEDTYEIGPGDVLHIAVFGQNDMTGDFPVDGRGIMQFPFLGRVKASGMSAAELERKLTTLLSDGYIRKPHVSIDIKEYHSRRVFVTGEVGKPGAYGLHPEASLLALLGEIGDLTANAGHEIIVIRAPKPSPDPDPSDVPSPSEDAPKGKNKPSPSPTPPPKLQGLPGEVPGSEIFHVSLRDLRSGNPDKDFHLEPGDTVFVPKVAQFYVIGNVGHAGAFRYEEGMTVYQALSLAGGISERGSSKIKVVRIVEGKRKEIKAGPTDPIMPEDTIVVPERFF